MLHQPSIIITDHCSPVLPEGLAALGYEVTYRPDISLEELDQIIGSYEGIIINTRTRLDQTRLSKAVRLKFICRLGSGLDIIDLVYCHERGIDVISSPEGNRQAVGEHALGMLLALLNKFKLAQAQFISHQWDREAARGRELANMKVGIIGYGHNGSAFVNLLAGFGMDIFIYDKYKKLKDSKICNSNLHICDMEMLLEVADVISFHIPLTDETAFLIDESFVKKCKRDVIIVNTSRGKIADLEALVQGIKAGLIGGLCLDVFPNEKPDTFSQKEKAQIDFLVSHPRVVLSPHVAGWTIESKEKIAAVLVEKVAARLKSQAGSDLQREL